MIDASELTALGRDLIAGAAGVAAKSTAVVRTSANEVLSLAQANAPVRTGELRDSGHVTQSGASAEVAFTSGHAGYVEEGTSVMAPEPYLAPAFDAVEPKFERELGDGVLGGIL